MPPAPHLPDCCLPGHACDRLRAAAAFAGTFLLIPLWDLYALVTVWRAGRQARARLLLRLMLLAGACLLVALVIGTAGKIAGPPARAIMAAHMPRTLALLAALAALTGLLSGLLLAATAAARRAGRAAQIAEGTLWTGAGVLAAPTGAVALIGVLLALRWAAPAGDGGDGTRILLAAGAGALLPALITARAGLVAWDAAASTPEVRWSRAGLEMAAAFNSQAGWMLSSVLIVEAAAGIEGLGRLLVRAVMQQGDVAVMAGIVWAAALALLTARLRAVLADALQATLIGPAGTEELRRVPRRAGSARVKLAAAGVLLALLAALTAAGLAASRGAAPQPDAAAVYTPRSTEHPFGTDQAGRDILQRAAQAQITTWGSALAGGAVALAFGGLWGSIAALVDRVLRRWPTLAELAGGLVRLPAEAALLLQPALAVLAFVLPRCLGDSTGVVIGAGAAIGLVLAPRMAWASASLLPRQPGRRGALAAAISGLLIASFGAMVYSIAAGMLFPGPDSATLGTLLAPAGEIIAGAQLAEGAGYLQLAAFLAAPGVAAAVCLYLLQDAAADMLSVQTGRALAQVFA